jgi:hypothetical protein
VGFDARVGLVVDRADRQVPLEFFEGLLGKGPLYAKVPMCYAPSEDKAREIAHRYHRWSLAGAP